MATTETSSGRTAVRDVAEGEYVRVDFLCTQGVSKSPMYGTVEDVDTDPEDGIAHFDLAPDRERYTGRIDRLRVRTNGRVLTLAEKKNQVIGHRASVTPDPDD